MIKNLSPTANLIIAGAFIALGVTAPGSTMTDPKQFVANVTGIATGFGLAWLLKTLADNRKQSKVSQ